MKSKAEDSRVITFKAFKNNCRYCYFADKICDFHGKKCTKINCYAFSQLLKAEKPICETCGQTDALYIEVLQLRKENSSLKVKNSKLRKLNNFKKTLNRADEVLVKQETKKSKKS